ncbi:unnamed protein product, partial [Meganyctiphanes norvegica]
SDEAKVALELMEIKSEADRIEIIQSYTSNPLGEATCIGCGVQLAVKKLMGIKNAHIILMTDGEQNTRLTIADVEDQLVQSGIPLHTIAIGDMADKNIEGMAIKTNGYSYMLSDEDIGYALMLALQQIQEYAEVHELPEYVHLAINSPHGNMTQVQWHITDAQAGNTVCVRITTDYHRRVKKGTKITFPNGDTKIVGKKKKIKYSSIDSLYTYEMEINDIQPGMYFSNSRLSSRHKDKLVLSAVSLKKTLPSDKDWQPLKAKAWVSSGAKTVDPCSLVMRKNPVIIYCDISIDHSPIVGAQVMYKYGILHKGGIVEESLVTESLRCLFPQCG